MKKKSIIRHLSERDVGRSSYRQLMRFISEKRWQNLSPDLSCEMERINLSGITCIDVESISGRYVLTGYNEGLVTVHDLEEILHGAGRKKKTASLITNSCESRADSMHKNAVTSIHWYPHDTGMFTSSSMDGNMFVWDTYSMTVADKFKFTPNTQNKMAYVYSHSISRSCLIALGGSLPEIPLWSIKTGAITQVLKGHKNRVNAVEWSPVCEDLLVSAGDKGKVYLWDVRQPRQFVFEFDYLNRGNFDKNRCAHTCNISMLKFLPCGSRFVTCGMDGEVRVWDALRGVKEPQVFFFSEPTAQYFQQLTVTPNSPLSQIVYVPSKSNIIGLDINTGNKVSRLQAHYVKVNVCFAHPTQELLMSGGVEGNLLFWKPKEDVFGDGDGLVPQVENVDNWSTDSDEEVDINLFYDH